MTNQIIHDPPKRLRCVKGCCDIQMQDGFDFFTDPRVQAVGLRHFRPPALVIASDDLLAAAEYAVHCLAGTWRKCSFCGVRDDLDVKPMPHTDTCPVPRLEAAVVKARGTEAAR